MSEAGAKSLARLSMGNFLPYQKKYSVNITE